MRGAVRNKERWGKGAVRLPKILVLTASARVLVFDERISCPGPRAPTNLMNPAASGCPLGLSGSIEISSRPGLPAHCWFTASACGFVMIGITGSSCSRAPRSSTRGLETMEYAPK